MMNLKKGTIALIVVLLFSFILSSTIYAGDFDVQVTSDKESIKPGEEVIVTVSANKLQTSANLGSNVYVCKLNYDRNVFEQIKEENITLLNDWVSEGFNAESGKLLIMKMEKVNENEELLKIKLKVKDNIDVKNTQFIVEESNYATSGQDLYADNATLNLKISSMNKNSIAVLIVIAGISAFIIAVLISFIISRNKKEEPENDIQK